MKDRNTTKCNDENDDDDKQKDTLEKKQSPISSRNKGSGPCTIISERRLHEAPGHTHRRQAILDGGDQNSSLPFAPSRLGRRRVPVIELSRTGAYRRRRCCPIDIERLP